MNKIRQWSLIVSAVSVISGLLLSVIPKSSQKSFFKVIVTVVLIYAVLQPAVNSKGIDFRINDFLSDNYQISENLDKYALSSMIRSAEKAIEDLLENKAEEQNLNCRFKCDCEMINDEIVIKQIIVYSSQDTEVLFSISEMISGLGIDKSYIVFKGE